MRPQQQERALYLQVTAGVPGRQVGRELKAWGRQAAHLTGQNRGQAACSRGHILSPERS